MKNLKTTSSILMLIAILLITSCKKETIQGPIGPTGLQGITGPTGAPGPQGNANVHSTTVTVASTDWTYTAPFFHADIAIPAITSDIINKGVVLVYMDAGNGVYGQLPVTIYPASTYSESLDIFTGVGIVEIRVTDSDLTQPVAPTTSKKFKIVVIEPSALKSNPTLDLSSYAKVVSTFNISK